MVSNEIQVIDTLIYKIKFPVTLHTYAYKIFTLENYKKCIQSICLIMATVLNFKIVVNKVPVLMLLGNYHETKVSINHK